MVAETGVGKLDRGHHACDGRAGGCFVQPLQPHLPKVSMQSAGPGLKALGGGEICGKARGWGAGPASSPSKEKAYSFIPILTN